MNASTFTARIIASTLADMFCAITGADRRAQGPAARRRERGGHEDARGDRLAGPRRGVRPRPPRAPREDHGVRPRRLHDDGPAGDGPQAAVEGDRRAPRRPRWYEISEAIEETVMEQKGLYPNVDFYAASVYHVLGIPTDLMTPIFALARMAGWTAHVREQYADNRVIRPGLGVRRPARPDLRADRGPRLAGRRRRRRRSAAGTGPRPPRPRATTSSRPMPIRWTPATPAIPRIALHDVDRVADPDLLGVARPRASSRRSMNAGGTRDAGQPSRA